MAWARLMRSKGASGFRSTDLWWATSASCVRPDSNSTWPFSSQR